MIYCLSTPSSWCRDVTATLVPSFFNGGPHLPLHGGFAACVRAILIKPSLQAVSWKHKILTSAPASISTQRYITCRVRRGTFPSSLSRRSGKLGDDVACTVTTLQSDKTLSADNLKRSLQPTAWTMSGVPTNSWTACTYGTMGRPTRYPLMHRLPISSHNTMPTFCWCRRHSTCGALPRLLKSMRSSPPATSTMDHI